MEKPHDIAIIGAGPAGLIAAEHLATAGHRVRVYDRMASPGRKLLIAGRGGLNLTHSEPLEMFLTRYGTASDWLAPSIYHYPPQALRDWGESLGQATFVGSSGRVFPKSMKAVQLLRAWLKRLEQLGVTYAPRHKWQGWHNGKLRFVTQAGDIYAHADATLLALGGASWPRLGSDGSWTDLLTQEGIAIRKLRPSNCGFITPWSDYFSTRFAGHPLKPVALTHEGITRQGELMITARGVEGGAIYALSSAIRETLENHGKATLQLDMRPSMTTDSLTRKLDAPRGNKSLSNHLQRAVISPLIIALLREAFPDIATATPAALATYLKSLPLTLTATTGIERAISTAGGIERSELTENFMLVKKPGVFAAGEMLDWEAPTGGYLLQACFSTGVMAAQGIERFIAD